LGVEPNPAQHQGEDTAAPKENCRDGDGVDVGSGPGKISLFTPIPWPAREICPHWEYGGVGQKQIFSVS